MEEHFFGQITQKAVVKYKGSFVLVKEHGEDKWTLPGGRLNFGESPEEGLLREIKEELGVDGIVEYIISVDTHSHHGVDKGKTSKFFVFYLVSILPNQNIIINNEIAEMSLVSRKEELKNLMMPQNQKKVLEKLFDEGLGWETVIDFIKVKKGGVPIDDVVSSLKRLSG